MGLREQIRRVQELLGGSARPGARAAEISAAEHRFGVRFPEDVKMLVSTFDGSDDGTPVEHGWVMFWSLPAWRRVSDDPEAARGSAIPNAILFADHSIVSWCYAIDIRPADAGSSVYMVDGVGPARLVASSLSAFLQAIIDDDDVLYRGTRLLG